MILGAVVMDPVLRPSTTNATIATTTNATIANMTMKGWMPIASVWVICLVPFCAAVCSSCVADLRVRILDLDDDDEAGHIKCCGSCSCMFFLILVLLVAVMDFDTDFGQPEAICGILDIIGAFIKAAAAVSGGMQVAAL